MGRVEKNRIKKGGLYWLKETGIDGDFPTDKPRLLVAEEEGDYESLMSGISDSGTDGWEIEKGDYQGDGLNLEGMRWKKDDKKNVKHENLSNRAGWLRFFRLKRRNKT